MNSEETPERVRLLIEECAELFATMKKSKQEVPKDNDSNPVEKIELAKQTLPPTNIPLPPHLAAFLAEQLPEQTNVVELIHRLLGEEADTTNPEEKKRQMYQRLVEIIFNKLSDNKVMQKDFGETIAHQLEIVNLLNAGK